jgi:hypothetical protein
MTCKEMNKTCRSKGAVGKDPLCYQWFREASGDLDKKSTAILDFGAGKDLPHTKKLRRLGWDVEALEFGDNVTDEHIRLGDVPIRPGGEGFYDVVIASNVLNVQTSERMMRRTMLQIIGCARRRGTIIVNYPLSPRKTDIDADSVERRLKRRGLAVLRVGGTKKAPVWECMRVV